MKRDYHIREGREVRRGGTSFSGAVHPAALVGLFMFFLSSVAYVYALNRGAVQGYEVKKIESDIAQLQEENRKLRISEAQALSLSRIEDSAKGKAMDDVSNLKTLGSRGAVALR
ncbi:MAG TPA: hypothetical protein VN420_03315 [Candidatus Fimivivens sp.]|nr:hypothetical protein [Candidatus Fimivivens sp.]